MDKLISKSSKLVEKYVPTVMRADRKPIDVDKKLKSIKKNIDKMESFLKKGEFKKAFDQSSTIYRVYQDIHRYVSDHQYDNM